MSSPPRIISESRLDFERLRAGFSPGAWATGEAASDALPAMLGQVLTVDSTVKLGRFCRVLPTTVLGAEREGGVGIFAPSGGNSSSPVVFVYLMGSYVPAEGDYLVCRFVDHRWVAETNGGGIKHGSGGILLPNCFCALPASLQMTSADPNCNYKMFQSCTLEYGPPPPSLASFGVVNKTFTSPQEFVDPITESSFYYWFTCYYNQFFLTRIFPTSPLGSPYRDGLLYAWVIGGYGNTCSPFQLETGSPFPGSDTSCSVTIVGS